MSKNEGWVKIHRGLSEDEIWNSEPFTAGQAWIDLILRANHKTGYWKDKRIKRGQLWTSKRKLMARWGVGLARAQRFLNRMVESEKISVEYHSSGLMITVLNYDKYQGTVSEQKHLQKQSQKQSEQQEREHSQNTNKNDKECYKNDKEKERRASSPAKVIEDI